MQMIFHLKLISNTEDMQQVFNMLLMHIHNVIHLCLMGYISSHMHSLFDASRIQTSHMCFLFAPMSIYLKLSILYGLLILLN